TSFVPDDCYFCGDESCRISSRGVNSASTRNSATGPLLYRRTTPKRRGRTHSNGCSSHSIGMPNVERRKRRRAFFSPLLSLITDSTAGTPVSRLKRFVSATNGQSCSGDDSRSYSQR